MGGGKHTPDQLLLEPVDDAFETSSSSVAYHSTPSDDHPSDGSLIGSYDRRRCMTYLAVLRSYNEAAARPGRYLEEAKDIIVSHKPGDWIELAGGLEVDDYEIPEATTLLLIGPRGSGKSTLVNRITKLFNDDPFAVDRAQVSYNLSSTEGTCFLQEYMIPKTSESLCIYDTPSLSTTKLGDFDLLHYWMTRGVSHGERIIRNSDNTETNKSINAMSRNSDFGFYKKRRVNFVILVVDGVSVLRSMHGEDKQYNDLLVHIWNHRNLSFKDNKPLVVFTHGDELTCHERAVVREYLGELMGIPPVQQIFDIPERNNFETDLAIVDMLRVAMLQADRNIAAKQTGEGNTNYESLEGFIQKVQSYDWIFDVLILCLSFAVYILFMTTM